MKSNEIKDLFLRFEKAVTNVDGVECWSARELQDLLGYTQWRNFSSIINKAKEACQNAGKNVTDHFADVSKMVDIGSNGQRKVEDILLTRYAYPLKRRPSSFWVKYGHAKKKLRSTS
jgi:DNA-damage-inducible protein D